MPQTNFFQFCRKQRVEIALGVFIAILSLILESVSKVMKHERCGARGA
jgi:hypothetical protein